MTEDEARDAVVAIAGERSIAGLDRYVDLVRAESERQNLISKTSAEMIWDRHVFDSAQLLRFDTATPGAWVDVGSGAGFPGLVIALLSDRPVVLVEPRRMRVEFLQACIDALDLGERVSIAPSKVQNADLPDAAVISARAVGSIGAMFDACGHITGASTRFVLPRGAAAAEEIAFARTHWHGMFHVEHSLTSPTSGIVVADRVVAR